LKTKECVILKKVSEHKDQMSMLKRKSWIKMGTAGYGRCYTEGEKDMGKLETDFRKANVAGGIFLLGDSHKAGSFVDKEEEEDEV
jgi:hypothetical protein